MPAKIRDEITVNSTNRVGNLHFQRQNIDFLAVDFPFESPELLNPVKMLTHGFQTLVKQQITAGILTTFRWPIQNTTQ
jgi:hypothetical protein